MTKTRPGKQGPAQRLSLLDVNVLIALTWGSHMHHDAAHQWFGALGQAHWATCALTQIAFIRICSNPKILPNAVTPASALSALEQLTAHPRHRYLDSAPAPASLPHWMSLSVVGHRQVTDAYLLALALHHDARLVTLDAGIPMLLSDVSERARCVEVIA